MSRRSVQHLYSVLFSRARRTGRLRAILTNHTRISLDHVHHSCPRVLTTTGPVLITAPNALTTLASPTIVTSITVISTYTRVPSVRLLSVLNHIHRMIIVTRYTAIADRSIGRLVSLLPRIRIRSTPAHHSPHLTTFLRSRNCNSIQCSITARPTSNGIHFRSIRSTGNMPIVLSNLIRSDRRRVSGIIRLVARQTSDFAIIPSDCILAIIALASMFHAHLNTRLGSLTSGGGPVNQFLQRIQLIPLHSITNYRTASIVLSLYCTGAIRNHLLRRFNIIRRRKKHNVLLSTLTLTSHGLSVISTFNSRSVRSRHLRRRNPQFLGAVLT